MRINGALPRFAAIDEIGGEDAPGEHHVSLRELLRVAERVCQPDMPDAQLLDPYVMTRQCVSPEKETVFDDLFDIASNLLAERLGVDGLEGTGAPSFDYPDEGERALEAALTGELPSQGLIALYVMSWHAQSGGSPWSMVVDLCRGQLLRRMSPPRHFDPSDSFDAWACGEHCRRLLSHEARRQKATGASRLSS